MNAQELCQSIDKITPQMVAFIQSMLEIPSVSGQEADLAVCVKQHLEHLGYASAAIDTVGNVWGSLHQVDTKTPTLLSLSPLDQPAPPLVYPPVELTHEHVRGWGASAGKGALAVQIYAGYLLQQLKIPLPWGFKVAATVQEHSGTIFGLSHFFKYTCPELVAQSALVLLGHPTGGKLYLGHRGKAEICLETFGRVCSSDTPWLGVNALSKSTALLDALTELASHLPSHPILEQATLAPVAITCKPGQTGMVPDICTISLDRHFLTTEPPEEIMQQIHALIHRLQLEDPELKATASFQEKNIHSYTGYQAQLPCLLPALLTPQQHPAVQSIRQILLQIQPEVEFGIWRTYTSGGYVASQLKAPVLGYSPGEERFAHTKQDHVSIAALKQALWGHIMIYLHFSEVVRNLTP